MTVSVGLQEVLVLPALLERLVGLAHLEVLELQVVLEVLVQGELLDFLDRLEHLVSQELEELREVPAFQVGFTLLRVFHDMWTAITSLHDKVSLCDSSADE